MAPSVSWLKADLQEYCQAAGIPFKSRDTKQDLVNLIQAATHNSIRDRPSNGTNHDPSPAGRIPAASDEQPNMGWLKIDLQAFCNRNGIEYTSRHTKQQLLDLVFQGWTTEKGRSVCRTASSGGSSCSSCPSRAPSGIPSEPTPDMQWSKAQLQAYCQDHFISFKARDTKQQLLDLIQGAVEGPAGTASYSGSEDSASCGSNSSSGSCRQCSRGTKTASKGAAASLRTDACTASASKVIERSSVLVCNVKGSSCDRMPGSWCNKWSEVTGRQRGRCAAAGCDEEGSEGGHVYMKGQPQDYCYIVPICSHHNSQRYNDAGYETNWFATKPNTAFMRIRVHQCFACVQ